MVLSLVPEGSDDSRLLRELEVAERRARDVDRRPSDERHPQDREPVSLEERLRLGLVLLRVDAALRLGAVLRDLFGGLGLDRHVDVVALLLRNVHVLVADVPRLAERVVVRLPVVEELEELVIPRARELPGSEHRVDLPRQVDDVGVDRLDVLDVLLVEYVPDLRHSALAERAEVVAFKTELAPAVALRVTELPSYHRRHSYLLIPGLPTELPDPETEHRAEPSADRTAGHESRERPDADPDGFPAAERERREPRVPLRPQRFAGRLDGLVQPDGVHEDAAGPDRVLGPRESRPEPLVRLRRGLGGVLPDPVVGRAVLRDRRRRRVVHLVVPVPEHPEGERREQVPARGEHPERVVPDLLDQVRGAVLVGSVPPEPLVVRDAAAAVEGMGVRRLERVLVRATLVTLHRPVVVHPGTESAWVLEGPPARLAPTDREDALEFGGSRLASPDLLERLRVDRDHLLGERLQVRADFRRGVPPDSHLPLPSEQRGVHPAAHFLRRDARSGVVPEPSDDGVRRRRQEEVRDHPRCRLPVLLLPRLDDRVSRFEFLELVWCEHSACPLILRLPVDSEDDGEVDAARRRSEVVQGDPARLREQRNEPRLGRSEEHTS